MMMPWDYVNASILSLDDEVMGFCNSLHSFIG
jgi:hypothetical protein